MNKQSITPEQFRAVAGTMPACRAADALGISQANFYRLAQSYSISTAFVYKPWKPEEKQIAQINVAVGIPVTGYPPHRSRRARFTHRAP
ncbi:hypothetical protein NXF88_27390, partial [Klebsiella pneumoniae]|nr:hypothetical protein [Klebsiella pneumoniae]MDS6809835.1 hypothetical protein [Klebsiella pneumoniae]